MKNYPIAKLIQWLIKNVFYSLIISSALSYICFSLFFSETFSHFALIFFYGFLISFVVFFILFVRLLHPLSKIIQKIEGLAKGQELFGKFHEDSFLDEPGEFYNVNKNLNRISNQLIWQKKIIGRDSSELEAVISTITGAILAVDKDQKILFFNNQAIMLFAPKKKEKIKDHFLSEVIRKPEILDMYKTCLDTHKIIKKNLSFHLFDVGEEIVYAITVAPLEEGNNQYRGAVGMFYDITNVKKTEKIQVDFISNVSHELRTPLTAIQGYVETLLSQLHTSEKNQIEKFLKIINRNVKRLVSLLNHFLELSQMESSLGLKKEEISTEKITQSIVKDLHIKDHKLKLDFLTKTVRADPHFLKQILYNLLDNASRYVPKNCLIEVIWSERLGEVLLTVKDHGKGIPSHQRERLFERFYRVDPSRKETRGAGIGLSIVKQLMEKHQGQVTVQSQEGKGTTFTCFFPDE